MGYTKIGTTSIAIHWSIFSTRSLFSGVCIKKRLRIPPTAPKGTVGANWANGTGKTFARVAIIALEPIATQARVKLYPNTNFQDWKGSCGVQSNFTNTGIIEPESPLQNVDSESVVNS
ncbi:unnamed protein product [Phytophthora lilii]|uniref:Unnamed protein product n=1 Tax=Phytophthora lilii TaxID=2077276 RepID=A0A9W6X0R1_9STRA|nr:unnamed protein product [Phytophthora lilii]